MHFQGEMVHSFPKNEPLGSESVKKLLILIFFYELLFTCSCEGPSAVSGTRESLDLLLLDDLLTLFGPEVDVSCGGDVLAL